MKPFRYRKPSAKTALGITKVKKSVKRKTGITAATKPLRGASNYKRKVKRKTGYYSEPMKMARAKRVPTPFGCLLPIMTMIILLSFLAFVL